MGLLAVNAGRDGWDWLLYGLSVLAGVIAIVGFGYWIREQRRRPEAQFRWLFSPTGRQSGLAPWPPHQVPELRAGETVLVQVAIYNAGDRSATDMWWNFVLDESVRVTWRGHDDTRPLTSLNARQAVGPSPQTVFYAGTDPWVPGNWLALFFLLTYEPKPDAANVSKARLVLTMSDNRFNATGRRWWPVLAVRGDVEWPPATSPWPPKEPSRRRLTWPCVTPREQVAVRAGVRTTARDVMLVTDSRAN